MIIVLGIITVIIFFLFFYKKQNPDNGFCNSLDCVRCSPVFSDIKSMCENEQRIKLKKGQIWKEPGLSDLPPYPELKTLLSPFIIENLQNSIEIFKKDFESLSKVHNNLNSPWQKTFVMNQGQWTGKCLNTKNTLRKILNEGSVSPHNLLLEDNIFGNVLFSTITDKITPHYGPTNFRLRLQICLEENDNFEMVCDNKSKKWVKNGMFLLNDWLLHEVIKINPKVSSKRSVLIIDLNRKYENI